MSSTATSEEAKRRFPHRDFNPAMRPLVAQLERGDQLFVIATGEAVLTIGVRDHATLRALAARLGEVESANVDVLFDLALDIRKPWPPGSYIVELRIERFVTDGPIDAEFVQGLASAWGEG